MKSKLFLFLASFVFVLLIYQIFVVSKTKKNRKNGVIKHPIEILYLVSVYKMDLKDVNYNLLLQAISIVSAIDIAIVFTIVCSLKGYLLNIILCIVCTFILILVTYHMVYLLFRKKGKKND